MNRISSAQWRSSRAVRRAGVGTIMPPGLSYVTEATAPRQRVLSLPNRPAPIAPPAGFLADRWAISRGSA